MSEACSAGFRINGREKCRQCGAGPEGPCWTDYRMTMAENERLREIARRLLAIITEGGKLSFSDSSSIGKTVAAARAALPPHQTQADSK